MIPLAIILLNLFLLEPFPPCGKQHYKGDLSELELYFVIVNNEYGEQTAEELIHDGKNIRVTNENVITFIHLVANHRLNTQVVEVPYVLLSFASGFSGPWDS